MNQRPMAQRVGMFGGAFDPPHSAHRALAQAALNQLRLDVLYILPTGLAWHKSRTLSDAEHRVAMCERAFADLPGVRIDQREIRRAGPSYTADTLNELSAEHPGAQLFLIVGADQLLAFRSWVRWDEVLRLAQLAVANRPVQLGAADTAGAMVETNMSSTELPFVRIDMPLQLTSSTAIRAHVRGQSQRHPDLEVLVPEGVARYISEHHLYESTT